MQGAVVFEAFGVPRPVCFGGERAGVGLVEEAALAEQVPAEGVGHQGGRHQRVEVADDDGGGRADGLVADEVGHDEERHHGEGVEAVEGDGGGGARRSAEEHRPGDGGGFAHPSPGAQGQRQDASGDDDVGPDVPPVEPAAAQGRAVGEHAEAQGRGEAEVLQGQVPRAVGDGHDGDREVAAPVEQGGHDQEGLGPVRPRPHGGRSAQCPYAA